GQPELRELILSPQLEQVHQRIVAASHLEALEQDETEAYVRHRLTVVGWRGDPDISRAVYPLVYKFSEGVPRRINLICSRLLLHGSVEQLHRLGVADMKEVLGELQGESLAVGNQLVDNDFMVDDVFEMSTSDEAARASSGYAGADRRAPRADVNESAVFSPAHPLRDVAATDREGPSDDSTESADDPEPVVTVEAPRATGTDDATPPAGSGDGSNDSSAAWRRRMRRNNRIF
ncbi:MAG: hypothetical protein RIC38_14335, partial [Chromatocurvus sp.]